MENVSTVNKWVVSTSETVKIRFSNALHLATWHIQTGYANFILWISSAHLMWMGIFIFECLSIVGSSLVLGSSYNIYVSSSKITKCHT